MRAVLLSSEYADPTKRGKLRALAGLGVTVTATVPAQWLPAGGSIHTTAWEQDSGVQIAPITVHGRLDAPDTLRWHAKALRNLLADARPDVVQIEAEPWTHAAAVGTAAARRLGIPAVLAVRESLVRGFGVRERLRRVRVLRRTAGIIGANSIAVRLVTAPHPPIHSTVVSPLSLTPPPLTSREPATALSIGFFGRLVPERGLDLLFRACVNLPGRWTITVVGTGPSQEELEGLAERLGIAAHVTWLGALPRHGIDAVWPTLDCVALPSRTTDRWIETVGRPALEAMARGLPVVATHAGALPEIVGSAGRIVAEDDVSALEGALDDLLRDPELRVSLGAIGRRRVLEYFSDSAIAHRTLEFWRTVLESATTSPRPSHSATA